MERKRSFEVGLKFEQIEGSSPGFLINGFTTMFKNRACEAVTTQDSYSIETIQKFLSFNLFCLVLMSCWDIFPKTLTWAFVSAESLSDYKCRKKIIIPIECIQTDLSSPLPVSIAIIQSWSLGSSCQRV